MIAGFGYLTCYQTRRSLKEQGDFAGDGFGEFSDGYTFRSDDDDEEKKPGFFTRRKARREAKKAELTRLRNEAHERAVEEVLRKVSASGIDTLTARERRILEEETRRQRLG